MKKLNLYIWPPKNCTHYGHVGIGILNENGEAENYFAIEERKTNGLSSFQRFIKRFQTGTAIKIITSLEEDCAGGEQPTPELIEGLEITDIMQRIDEVKSKVNQATQDGIFYGFGGNLYTCSSLANDLLERGGFSKFHPLSEKFNGWQHMLMIYLKPNFVISLGTPLFYHLFIKNEDSNTSIALATTVCMLNFIIQAFFECSFYRYFKFLDSVQNSHLLVEKDNIDLITSFTINGVVGLINAIYTKYEKKLDSIGPHNDFFDSFMDCLVRSGSIIFCILVIGKMINLFLRRFFEKKAIITPHDVYYKIFYYKKIKPLLSLPKNLQKNLALKELSFSIILAAFVFGLVLSNNFNALHTDKYKLVYGIYFFIGCVLAKLIISYQKFYDMRIYHPKFGSQIL